MKKQIGLFYHQLKTNDIANAIISTKDDGFAIIGNTKSTDGDFNFKKREGSDVFLMKFNYLSELQWIKTYGGSDDDRGHGLVQLPDGGYVLMVMPQKIKDNMTIG